MWIEKILFLVQKWGWYNTSGDQIQGFTFYLSILLRVVWYTFFCCWEIVGNQILLALASKANGFKKKKTTLLASFRNWVMVLFSFLSFKCETIKQVLERKIKIFLCKFNSSWVVCWHRLCDPANLEWVGGNYDVLRCFATSRAKTKRTLY